MGALDNPNVVRVRRNLQLRWCLLLLVVVGVSAAYLLYRPKSAPMKANKKPEVQNEQAQNKEVINFDAENYDTEGITTTGESRIMYLFSTTIGNWQDMVGRPHYLAWDYALTTTNIPENFESDNKEDQDGSDDETEDNKLPQIPKPTKSTPKVSDKDVVSVVKGLSFLQTTDPLKLAKISFLDKYKNPCFTHESVDNLLCLPSFFLAGMPRSGTSDLYNRLSNHPHIIQSVRNSLPWWIKPKDGQVSFQEYLENFIESSKSLQNLAEMEEKQGIHSHEALMFDSNPTLFWRGQLDEATKDFMTPVHIKQVLPNAKIIVMLRSPVDRLYSDYMHYNPKATPADFDKFVNDSVTQFKSCMSGVNDVKLCVHKNLADDTKPHLETGIYEVFYEEWIKYFNKENILVIRVEDYGDNLTSYIKKICDFLGIPQVSDTVVKNLASDEFVGEKSDGKSAMLEQSKTTLKSFYAPYNNHLAQLLNDDGFKYV